MKRILVAMALVLMSAGTAMANGGVSFGIGINVPSYPFGYPTYTYPAYAYSAPSGCYSTPYRNYYPPPHAVFGYNPSFSTVIVNRGYGHGHFNHGGGGFHRTYFGFTHGGRFGR
jgi:hypothetical protein